jgi:hypothetical protein
MRCTEFGRFTYLKLLNGRIYMSQAYTREGREKTIGQLEKREEWGEGRGPPAAGGVWAKKIKIPTPLYQNVYQLYKI